MKTLPSSRRGRNGRRGDRWRGRVPSRSWSAPSTTDDRGRRLRLPGRVPPLPGHSVRAWVSLRTRHTRVGVTRRVGARTGTGDHDRSHRARRQPLCRPSGRRGVTRARPAEAAPPGRRHGHAAGRDRGHRRGARGGRARRGGAGGHLGVDQGEPVVANACLHRVGGVTEVHAPGGRGGDRRLSLQLGQPAHHPELVRDLEPVQTGQSRGPPRRARPGAPVHDGPGHRRQCGHRRQGMDVLRRASAARVRRSPLS